MRSIEAGARVSGNGVATVDLGAVIGAVCLEKDTVRNSLHRCGVVSEAGAMHDAHGGFGSLHRCHVVAHRVKHYNLARPTGPRNVRSAGPPHRSLPSNPLAAHIYRDPSFEVRAGG